jgi:conjugative relaxase-like TrwC/TraI family protein
MSIARLSAGAGYQYLIRHTACGDVPRDPSQSLTAYYAESGYPPGTWWGAGLDVLGDHDVRVQAGSVVTEDAMARLFGAGRDPATDTPLGRPYPVFRSSSQRIADAVAALPAGLDDGQRAAAVDAVRRSESGRRTRGAVAGFDLTFSARKSASVLWGLSDPATQAVVLEAHRAAVHDTLALIEDRAVFTRVGARSCAQVPTKGMVAAVFDHWDTRLGDPDLHSHVVIANRVQGLDGQWRSLDSRALHHAAVAFSEVYDNLLADRLQAALPVRWSLRDRGPRRSPGFEIDGVPDWVLKEFSLRTRGIDAGMTSAVAEFHARNGRAPSPVETTRLRQKLTLATRPAKTVHALAELVAWWRVRAAALIADLPEHVTGPLLPILARLGEAGEHRNLTRRRQAERLLEGVSETDRLRLWSAEAPPPRGINAGDTRPRIPLGGEPPMTAADAVRLLNKYEITPSLRRTAPHQSARAWADAEIPDPVIADLAATTLTAVLDRRSTWTRWNLLAEAARATRPIRCATTTDRHALHDRVVTAALDQCISLETPEVFTVPAAFLTPDGVSVFTRPGQGLYTHPAILDAEARLLAALDDLTAPAVDPTAASSVGSAPSVDPSVDQSVASSSPVEPSVISSAASDPALRQAGDTARLRLATDQADAVAAIATSGRRVDVLVGPAGTGKTTTLAALRTVWETQFGRGSVVGLAPSATAAAELSARLGIGCENTAKWLHETTGPGGQERERHLDHLHDSELACRRTGDTSVANRVARAIAEVRSTASAWRLEPGQLLIVDEASLAGTLTLDDLTTQATAAGAKVLLVGDHHQLSAVDAGGAFGLLAATPQPRELTSLWRFTHRWEAHATRHLRHGDPSVLDTYQAQRRITDGTSAEVLHAAYSAWTHDLAAGASTLLLAADTDTVGQLNDRAHQDRVTAGLVEPATEVPAADGVPVGVGDIVLTRRNDRRLLTSGGQHVRNGDRWTITATHPDGAVTALRDDSGRRAGAERVLLPAAYVRDHLELGYATTIHRAQGVTVDHAHVLVTPGMSREALYVAITRGSDRNQLYVPLDTPDHGHDEIPDPGRPDPDALDVLAGILGHSDRELSATETLRDNQHSATKPSRLLAIRDSLQAGTPWAIDTSDLSQTPASNAEVDAAIAEIDALLHPDRVQPDADRDTSPLRRMYLQSLEMDPLELERALIGDAPTWDADDDYSLRI